MVEHSPKIHACKDKTTTTTTPPPHCCRSIADIKSRQPTVPCQKQHGAAGQSQRMVFTHSLTLQLQATVCPDHWTHLGETRETISEAIRA